MSALGPDVAGDDDGFRAFWADAVADEVEAAGAEDPIVIKGGVSPSGVPHVGHFNEIMRGFYVAEALRDRGHAVRQVFTADDKDALRSVPRRLADVDWNLVELGDVDAGALGENLGTPYTDIPDPFGDCHGSYGAHFTDLLRRSADMIGVPVEFVSNTDLYADGAFEDVTRELLAGADRAREVLAEYQAGVDEDYVPFVPQCAECGRLTTTVESVDLGSGTVDYACTSLEAGGRTIEGCGHRGTATLREGKLPWRFEWPSQWKVLGVDFEPFGKDHAEGSWPSGEDIARRVLDIEPPVPMTYEWFTLDGEALSSSSGNVVTVAELLDLVEPEVLRYFFAKRPHKQRDLDLARIDRLVDEFDRFEATFFGEVEASDTEERLADRAYPAVLPLSVEARSAGGDRLELNIGKLDGHGGRSVVPIATEAVEVDDTAAVLDRIGPEVASVPTLPADGIGGLDVRVRVRDLAGGAFAGRVRLAYTFAAVLGMTDSRELRLELAGRAGLLDDATPGWAREVALGRVGLARTWARRHDNEYNYRLRASVPDVEFDDAVGAALDELAGVVADGADGDAIQAAVYETAEAHGLEARALFAAGYELLFGRPRGPRLGPFLAALDPAFAADRLRRER